MNNKIYIIILNWNGWKDTIACLESIYQSDYPDFRVLVCDNASTDQSAQKIMEWKNVNCKSLIFLPTGSNLGYAGGNNVGIRYAMGKGDADFIWILNNDTIVAKEALSKLIDHMVNNNHIGICGSKLMYYDFPEKIQALGGRYNCFFGSSTHITELKNVNKLDYVVGASMMVSAKFIQEIGLMSEEYFLYYEELDWAMRSKGKFEIGCALDSIVYHKEGATIGSSAADSMKKSLLADYYSIRNRIKFTKKFYKFYLPTVYIGLILAIFNRIRRRQIDRVWMILKLMISCGEFKKSGQ